MRSDSAKLAHWSEIDGIVRVDSATSLVFTPLYDPGEEWFNARVQPAIPKPVGKGGEGPNRNEDRR